MPKEYKLTNAKPKSHSNPHFKEASLDASLSFSFKNISLYKGILCFNNEAITKEYYSEILEFIHYLSVQGIEELIKDNNDFNFHPIDLRFKHELKLILLEIFKGKAIDIPEIISFRAVAQDIGGIAPRFIGYFGKNDTINLLFLDFYHTIYSNGTNQRKWFGNYCNFLGID